MMCQMLCWALGHNGKEATVPDRKELMEEEALSCSRSPITKQNESMSHQPVPLQPLDHVPPEGTQSKLGIVSPEHLQKEPLTPRAQTPATALFQQNLLSQRPFQPSPAFPFPRSQRVGRHQPETCASLSPRQGSGQRSSEHLGERMGLAAWDVPAVPTLQCPVVGLEK